MSVGDVEFTLTSYPVPCVSEKSQLVSVQKIPVGQEKVLQVTRCWSVLFHVVTVVRLEYELSVSLAVCSAVLLR